jgi:glycosyltransferase involved in cell wall biosynthesis
MKIIHSIPYFVPAWDYGGPLRSCYHISKELARKGHDVSVYTTDSLNGHERITQLYEIIDGIKVKRFKNINNTLSYRYNISTPIGLVRCPNDFSDSDIVHMHEYRTLQNILIRRHAKNNNVPYILQARGSLTTFFHKNLLKKTFDRLWGYKILQDAARVIALTTSEAEECKIMGVPDDKIEIVPNGIELDEFEHLPPKGQFRSRYALDESIKIILYLGRIHQIKGLDLLVKAFTRSIKEMDRVKLVITGPDDGFLGVLEKLVRELAIEEKVLLTGPLHGEERLTAYVDADVYILPSFYEAFGLTVLEAMACGKPVIVTDRCGLADVVNNETGLVVPYDEEPLSQALIKLLSDEHLRQEFGASGKLLVREKFNWERITEQLERIYEQVLRGNNL